MLKRYEQVALLLALLLVEVPAIVASLFVLILSLGMGLVWLFPPQVRMVRRLAERRRGLVRLWTDIEIAAPYLPEPLPPRPQSDGMYRSNRTLYRSPRVPAWNDRWKWLVSDPATWRDAIWLVLDPVVKVGLSPLLLAAPGRGLRVYGGWCELLLAATARSRLAGQVNHLQRVRNLAVDSQAAEMRRIERDLHDGTQARLVAIGMTLGAAEQLVDADPAAAKALMTKAREASSETLTELRTVIRGIHPPVLAERGLADAVRALGLDSPLTVTVEVDLPHRPAAPVEAAAYFAVSELLSNAARHGDATRAAVDISARGSSLRVTVTDDGMGGADPARGSGLLGIERRLAAFDGVLALNSPPGGPTTVVMDLPKVLPEHWSGLTPGMPRWKTALVISLWLTAWCPLFPQGLVAAFFKIFGLDERAWFLALYLPPAWQWPVIVAMILLGTTMYALAMLVPAQHGRERCLTGSSPLRPWLCR